MTFSSLGHFFIHRYHFGNFQFERCAKCFPNRFFCDTLKMEILLNNIISCPQTIHSLSIEFSKTKFPKIPLLKIRRAASHLLVNFFIPNLLGKQANFRSAILILFLKQFSQFSARRLVPNFSKNSEKQHKICLMSFLILKIANISEKCFIIYA